MKWAPVLSKFIYINMLQSRSEVEVDRPLNSGSLRSDVDVRGTSEPTLVALAVAVVLAYNQLGRGRLGRHMQPLMFHSRLLYRLSQTEVNLLVPLNPRVKLINCGTMAFNVVVDNMGNDGLCFAFVSFL